MKDTEKIFERIYSNVFCNTLSNTCYIFLCGGSNKSHIRNNVRKHLEEKNYQVLYPEDLFMDMLNRNKRTDLFDFENLLAQNCDILCVICESMGSAVELGAFVQNESIKEKMVVAIENKFARDKSFIMMGPVKYLCKKDKSKLVLYKKDEIESFIQDLDDVFRKTDKRKRKESKDLLFDNLATYIAFIPLIIWFFEQLGRKNLFDNLKKLLLEKNKLPSTYNELFNASIKYLLKERTIIADYSGGSGEEQYALSSKGYNDITNIFKKINMYGSTKLRDEIRCDILKEQLS